MLDNSKISNYVRNYIFYWWLFAKLYNLLILIKTTVGNREIFNVWIFAGWRGVATWRWVANDDNCGICRMPFDASCPDCKIPGDDCPLGNKQNLIYCLFCESLSVSSNCQMLATKHFYKYLLCLLSYQIIQMDVYISKIQRKSLVELKTFITIFLKLMPYNNKIKDHSQYQNWILWKLCPNSLNYEDKQ